MGMSTVIDGSASVTINSGAVLGITSGTAVASTSGTSIDFTSIPSWVKRITVMFTGVSTNGTSNPLMQIGAGSVLTSGYLGSAQTISTAALATTGWGLGASTTAAFIFNGSAVITNMGSNVWSMFGVVGYSNSAGVTMFGGSVSLGGVLDRVRITTVNGTDTFDAGSINILYE